MGFASKIIKWAYPDPEHEKVLERNSPDWLSNLPIDILHHILSFLSATDVVKTSLLSRKWRYAWASTPFLNFNFKDFRNQEHCLALDYDECIIKFWAFVKWTIMIRDASPIYRLRFYCDYLNAYQLESLFNICVMRHIQELEIVTGYGVLHYPKYSAGKKHVWACIRNLNSLIKLEPWTGCWNLKTLNLVGVQFPDADITEKLLSECGVLENLSLENCCFPAKKILKISANRLRKLNFVNDGPNWWEQLCMFKGELELNTPNLQSFCYIGPVIRLCGSSSDMLFLKNASITLRFQNHQRALSLDLSTMLSGIHCVEELSVSAVFVLYFSPAFGTTICTFSPFDCLRHLKLALQCNADHCEGLINLLHHSPNLEALCIRLIQTWKTSCWESREADVPCLSHKLKEIEIVACPNAVNVLQLIKFFLQNGKSLERINLMQKEQKVDPESFYALREVQIASEAVSVSVNSISAAAGRKELIQLVYGKFGVSVQTKAGKSKFTMKRSLRIAAKKSGGSTGRTYT